MARAFHCSHSRRSDQIRHICRVCLESITPPSSLSLFPTRIALEGYSERKYRSIASSDRSRYWRLQSGRLDNAVGHVQRNIVGMRAMHRASSPIHPFPSISVESEGYAAAFGAPWNSLMTSALDLSVHLPCPRSCGRSFVSCEQR